MLSKDLISMNSKSELELEFKRPRRKKTFLRDRDESVATNIFMMVSEILPSEYYSRFDVYSCIQSSILMARNVVNNSDFSKADAMCLRGGSLPGVFKRRSVPEKMKL